MTKSIVHVFALLLLSLATLPLEAQTGRVEGLVTRAADGTALGGVFISVEGTSINTVTDPDGQYVLPRVPVGTHIVLYRWLGFRPQQANVTVQDGQTETVNVSLTAQVVSLGEIVVAGASRVPERIVEAPSAVSTIRPVTLRNHSLTGQVPKALTQTPGVDVVQSGVNDFNVNTRGFNSSLNRRVLVLQDGRDLAIAFLGSQEWNGLSMPMEDFGQVEMVRGPGSALYGANAFAGVLSIQTPPARDVAGTKISLGGGELSTFRGDLRHAGVQADGRAGYRFNLGYYRSDSYSRSRTAFDGSDVVNEYNEVADVPLQPGTTAAVTTCAGLSDCLFIERVPLAGQTRDAATGAVSGNPDGLQNIYGSARFDYYSDGGSVLTAEGGAARVENELFVTGIGRVQVPKAIKPWARVNWGSERFNLMGWYTGRKSIDDQISLSSGIPLRENSSVLHAEGQFNQSFAEDRSRIVLGASYRKYLVDTEGTLMNLANDDRSDDYYSVYGQLEFRPVPEVRFVAAGRIDDGTLFDTQFSPKGAIVITPHEDHSIRATVNRAFQTPNYSEFYLQVPAGLPQTGPASLEAGLESYFATLTNPAAVGPALAGAMSSLGLTTDLPWNFSDTTQILALGNESLDVETVTGWEIGYKGNVTDNFFVTADFYFNRLSNFVTDLLPGVNQAQYPSYSLGDGGLDVAAQLAAIDNVLSGVGLPAGDTLRVLAAFFQAQFGGLMGSAIGTPALATLPNGERAVVVSYANAGKVDEKGVEVGFGYGFTPEFRLDASYTFFDFDVKDDGLAQAGQDLVPNTPRHKGSVGLSYTGQRGFDASLNVHFTDAYDWAAGVFSGRVPSRQFVDASLGYQVNNYLRLHVVGTNLLDQERFQLYGGSVIGRRILGGMTATF
jgi:iron complex outermembrane receptor protein